MRYKPVTLHDILKSRDERAARQRQLLEDYAGQGDTALISFTVNYPGEVKRNADALKIYAAGAEAMERLLKNAIIHSERRAPLTGPEGFWVVKIQPREAKALTAALEQSHPLGRLFDIDVLGHNGAFDRPSLGLPPRVCLICGEIPAVCRRENRHTLDELKAHIHEMIERWERETEMLHDV